MDFDREPTLRIRPSGRSRPEAQCPHLLSPLRHPDCEGTRLIDGIEGPDIIGMNRLPFQRVVAIFVILAQWSWRDHLASRIPIGFRRFAEALIEGDALPNVGHGVDSTTDPRLGHRAALLIADDSAARLRVTVRSESGDCGGASRGLAIWGATLTVGVGDVFFPSGLAHVIAPAARNVANRNIPNRTLSLPISMALNTSSARTADTESAAHFAALP